MALSNQSGGVNKDKQEKEVVTFDTFMTTEELNAKHRKRFRELEVLKSELNSGSYINNNTSLPLGIE